MNDVTLRDYVDQGFNALGDRISEVKSATDAGLSALGAQVEATRAESARDHANVEAALREIRAELEALRLQDAVSPSTSEVVNIAKREAEKVTAHALRERDERHEQRRTISRWWVGFAVALLGAMSGAVGAVVAVAAQHS